MARVLVVDDDPAICDLIHDVLQEVRLEAVCVNGDEAAYRRIPTLPTIQALVVDVNLGPGTTGYDVARFARQVIPGLPVLYISGEISADTFRSCAVPDSGFVQKPFLPDELLAALVGRLRPGEGSPSRKRKPS